MFCNIIQTALERAWIYYFQSSLLKPAIVPAISEINPITMNTMSASSMSTIRVEGDNVTLLLLSPIAKS